MAVEGPHYPEHPPLSHPGWWRNRRIWLGLAVAFLLLIVVDIILHIGGADTHAVTGMPAGAAVPPADGVDSVLSAVLWLFNTLVFLTIVALLAMVIMSWLTAFKVLDPENAIVDQLDRALYGLTNPLVNPVRRLTPAIGGLDFSPVIVVLALAFLQVLVNKLVAGVG